MSRLNSMEYGGESGRGALRIAALYAVVAGLWVLFSDELLALFVAASRGGATLLIATHELSFVAKVARLLALRDGALLYDGAPADVDVHGLVLPG